MNPELEAVFPGLANAGYAVTSPETTGYNCIAWAAGAGDCWWWPDLNESFFWPDGIERRETLEMFVRAFAVLGYSECGTGDFETGREKVAIFVRNGLPTHAARQLADGSWTSKCGAGHDIAHALDGLNGELYGQPVVFMARQSSMMEPTSTSHD